MKGTGFLGLFMKVLERLLWISGAVLLSIFIGHLTLGELQRAHAVAAFKTQQATAGSVAVAVNSAPVTSSATLAIAVDSTPVDSTG